MGDASGTCQPWTTVDQIRVASPDCADPDKVTDAQLNDAIDVASDLLWRASGHRFPGQCTTTLRPRIVRSAAEATFAPPDWTYVWGGSGEGPSELDLSRYGLYPVVSIGQVLVDGAVLDPARYRVDDAARLVRLRDADGSGAVWPCAQDLTRDDTEADTWSVTVTWGTAPPPSGVAAANALACLLGRDAAGEDCGLPASVTAVNRAGISYEVEAAVAAGADDGWGVPAVVRFLDAVNPQRLSGPGRFINPDRWRPPVRADTAAGS